MRIGSRQRVLRWLQLGLAWAIVACARTEDPDGNLGSETHWLTACTSNAQCGSEGLSCECGVCSLPCDEDARCGKYGAVCSVAGEAAHEALCGSSRTGGVCLPPCEGGCSGEQSCVADACVPKDRPVPASGATLGDGGALMSGPQREPSDVQAEVPPAPVSDGLRDAGRPLSPVSPVPEPMPAPSLSEPTRDAGSPADASVGVSDAGGVANDADDPADASVDDASTSGVVLRAVLAEASSGTTGIAAEWVNGTSGPIFLAGCGTASGWSFDGAEWEEYGSLVLCAAEGPMVSVGPGESYRDTVGVPPSRGVGVWRLVGTYGAGCVPPDGLFSEATCASTLELTSNEVSLPR